MTIEFGIVATSEVLEIVSIVEELRNTSATNEKVAILEQHRNNEGLKTILELTYNPFKKYKITEKTLEMTDYYSMCHKDLITLTEILAESNINDKLREWTSNFLARTDEQIRELYKGVLLKDLKLGINSKTINKVWKDLIPTSEIGFNAKCMLASKYDFNKPPKKKGALTIKLDGIRCWAFVTPEKVTLLSRQGKLIEGCQDIETELKKYAELKSRDFLLLDGEILAKGYSNKDVYKATTKIVRTKDEYKTGLDFHIFDTIGKVEYEELKGVRTYEERRVELDNMEKDILHMQLETLKIVPVLDYTDGVTQDNIISLLNEVRKQDCEGLMWNDLNAVYEFKRSKSILKLKVMQTMDLKVIGFEEGQGRNAGKLGALIVEYKGNSVGVGSGFTDYDREFIWNNQDKYLEKICEVQYFEITKDKNGVESLRFPIYKHMRTDKTEPSLY